MDRRAFLRRSAVVAGGVVAADQVELLEKLGGWVRRFFPSAAVAPSPFGQSTLEYVRVEELRELYRKSTTQLFRTYTRYVPEYEWFDRVPRSNLIVGTATENRLPLTIVQDPKPLRPLSDYADYLRIASDG
jgi:hypothetical protein